jgi:hypothetical protein
MHAMAKDNEISILNRILSFEKKAAATFDRVIPTENSHDRAVWDLVGIRNDHNQAVGKLDHAIRDLGGSMGPNSNVQWPDVPSLKNQKLDENPEAIRSLMQGEQSMIDECQKAVRSGNLGPLSKTLINSEILPVLKNHVEILRQYA